MCRALLKFWLVFAVFAGVLASCSNPSTSTTGPREPEPGAAPPLPPRPLAGGKARDAYVLLSGGGTPLSNNYSQYVQAKAVAEFFARSCPPEASWIFFGVGNRPDAAPILADVRRETKNDGRLVQSWLPGVLKQNRAATRDNFFRALRDEILPTVSGGGTLFLFVGDHGEVTGEESAEQSAITMWQLRRSRRRGANWVTDEKELLTVSDLRGVLVQGLGQGRVVFCMTQCHSGGFHQLGLARAKGLPREWFATAPRVAESPTWTLTLRAAGFTATDQDSVAAGCDANPDPDFWAGYERFIPEALFGADLLSGQPKQAAAPSFSLAHEAATLIDQTIDKPRATSEFFLEAWGRAIETELANSLNVTPQAQRAVTAYQRVLDTGKVAAADDALRERAAQFGRFTRQLGEQLPTAKELLATGTRQQLETALRGRGERGGGPPRGGRRGALTELRRLWSETLRPAWKKAVLDGRAGGLNGAALEFEQHLLKLEEGGRDFLLPRGNNDTPLMNEVYWKSGYAEPATLDRTKAEAIARWAAERRFRIITWAAETSDATLRAAAGKIGPGPALKDDGPSTMSRRTAIERVLFYRRVLAAWEFLIAIDAQAQLADLRGLLELERVPLLAGAGLK